MCTPCPFGSNSTSLFGSAPATCTCRLGYASNGQTGFALACTGTPLLRRTRLGRTDAGSFSAGLPHLPNSFGPVVPLHNCCSIHTACAAGQFAAAEATSCQCKHEHRSQVQVHVVRQLTSEACPERCAYMYVAISQSVNLDRTVAHWQASAPSVKTTASARKAPQHASAKLATPVGGPLATLSSARVRFQRAQTRCMHALTNLFVHARTVLNMHTACQPGNYSIPAASTCTTCPPGSTSDVAASTCLCVPGYALSGSGVTLTCTACVAGTYSPAGAPCISASGARERAREPGNSTLSVHGPELTPGCCSIVHTVRLLRQHVQQQHCQHLHELSGQQLQHRRELGVHLLGRLLQPHRPHQPDRLQRYARVAQLSCTGQAHCAHCILHVVNTNTACLAGTYSNSGSTSCTACPAGSTSTDGAAICACLPGFALSGSSADTLSCTGMETHQRCARANARSHITNVSYVRVWRMGAQRARPAPTARRVHRALVRQPIEC